MSKPNIHIHPHLVHTAEDPDELAVKYRVFREPEEAEEHPVEVRAQYLEREYTHVPAGLPMADWVALEEVETFTFVLKPDTDHHARVAIAAYAESVRPFKPNLADDLMGVLSLGEWDRENGGDQGQ